MPKYLGKYSAKYLSNEDFFCTFVQLKCESKNPPPSCFCNVLNIKTLCVFLQQKK